MTSDLTSSRLWDSRWSEHKPANSRLLSTRELDRYILKMLDHIPRGGKMLELGGAPGRIAERHFLYRPDLHIDCIDFSSVGVRKTCKLYEKLGIKGDVIESDFRGCADRWGTYDLVCSYGLIEHFDDISWVIESHFKFAGPGGMVGISVPNYAAFPVKPLLDRFSTETIRTHNIGCMNLDVLKTGMLEAGGTDVEAGYIRGAVLPHSVVNHNLGGTLYRRFAQAWNLSNSLIGLATGDHVFARQWDHGLYVLARKAD